MSDHEEESIIIQEKPKKNKMKQSYRNSFTLNPSKDDQNLNIFGYPMNVNNLKESAINDTDMT